MRVVLDEGVPRQVAQALRDKGIDASRFPREWAGARNGELIAHLDGLGFDALLTNDKNIVSQQSLRGRSLAAVALPHNKRRAILERMDDVVDTLLRSRPGQHVVIGWDGSRVLTRMVNGREIREEMPPVLPFEM